MHDYVVLATLRIIPNLHIRRLVGRLIILSSIRFYLKTTAYMDLFP